MCSRGRKLDRAQVWTYLTVVAGAVVSCRESQYHPCRVCACWGGRASPELLGAPWRREEVGAVRSAMLHPTEPGYGQNLRWPQEQTILQVMVLQDERATGSQSIAKFLLVD